MFWKLGALFNTLRFRVEKDLNETLFQNEEFKTKRWPVTERITMLGAKHVFWANFIIFLLFSFSSLTMFFFYEKIQSWLPSSISGLKQLIEFQTVLLGTQATILGLVFPLVIAFIGVLLQGKSSNESLWTIYRHNSGFMLVGFSMLTLTVVYSILALVQPWLSHQLKVAISIFSSLWFTLNVILSVRFLWKTVEFLSLNSRMNMIVEYAINEVIVTEIKTRLLKHHCISATQTGLLSPTTEDSIAVHTYSISQQFTSEFILEFKEPRRIENVWYRFLNLAVKFWSIQVKWCKSSENSFDLYLPFSVSDSQQRKIALARTNGPEINFISKMLIKFAVKTSKKAPTYSLTLDNIIGALFTQIEDALKENNARAFDVAKKNLVDLQRIIESSMFFINDDNQPDSWLLLPEGVFFSRNFLDEFIKESIAVGRQTTRRIIDDSSYYESWCYLYLRLFSSSKVRRPKAVSEAYLNGHYYLWANLMSWMSGSVNQHDAIRLINDTAIKKFVGSWEGWERYIDNNFESTKDDTFQLACHHLENTSCLVIHAIRYQNKIAANWAADTLVYWYELFSERTLRINRYNWHSEIITPQILTLRDSHPVTMAVARGNALNSKDAIPIALMNYWADIRCITAAYILKNFAHSEDTRFQEILNALINCKRIEPTAGIHPCHYPLKNSVDVLGMFLRQNGNWETQHAYKQSLEKIIDRVSRIEEPEWVSGRIYSSFGNNTDYYMSTFFSTLGVGLTLNEFSLSRHWTEFLKSDALTEAQRVDILRELQGLTDIDAETMIAVKNYFSIDEPESQRRKSLFVISINKIISDIKSESLENILEAPIDNNRLLQFGLAATGSTFTLKYGPIPMCLFSDIDYVDDFEYDLTIVNIINFEKSEVSENVDINRAINENEWLNEVVAQRAISNVFEQLFHKINWVDARFEKSIDLIKQVLHDSTILSKQGLTPIIFVGAWDVYNLLEASKWPQIDETKRLPFDITIEAGKSSDYVCHISNIEVYRIPFGTSNYTLLVAKESLHKLEIKRFGDGRNVNADFTRKTDRDPTGTLSLFFGVNCQFIKTKGFKYISLNPDDE